MLHATSLTACAVAWLALVGFGAGSAFGHATHEARVAHIEEQLIDRPNDPALFFQLAEINCEHGDWQIALLNLDRVDQLTSGTVPTAVARAHAYLTGGQPARARAVLDPFVALHPEDAGALLTRARALAQLDPSSAALPDYRAALRLAPHAEPDLVAEVAAALGTHNCTDEALATLDHAIGRLGPIPSLMTQAIDLERAAGSFDAALVRVETLRQQGPRPEPWMERRAEILLEAGRLEESRGAWRTLKTHLASLTPGERSSHAICLCAERVGHALATLNQLTALPSAVLNPLPVSR